MPKLEYFIVAESHAIDQSTNRLSIFNVVEELTAANFPSVLPVMVAITCVLREETDADINFQGLLRVSGAPIGQSQDFPINFVFGDRRRMRLMHVMNGSLLLASGDLLIELQLNGKHVAQHQIVVTQSGISLANRGNR